MTDLEIIGMLKSFVKNSLKGIGALKGAPCEIQSITETSGGHVVTFKWQDNEGVTHTGTMTVMDGANVVNVTPILESGTKIAEIAVNGTVKEIYAPSGGSGSSALSGLTDVDISSLTDGDVLVYDNTSGKWINESPEEGVLVEAVLSKSAMPTASVDYNGIPVLYIGSTSASYTKGHIYVCEESGGTYSWTDITPSGGTSQVTQFEVTTSGWTADTTSQSGSTLYKKAIALTSVGSTFGVVSIGATGTLPTAAQQAAFDLVQYVTIDSAVPCLYLYASDIPTDSFYIKVEGVA